MKVFKGRFFTVPFLSFSALFLLFLGIGVCLAGDKAVPARSAYVSRVVDGDTVVLAGGERVRLLGIDTPEFGEPFFTEAKEKTASLVLRRKVRLAECREERSDKYGRTLARVYVDGLFVNGELLREGLARTLIIPPCGLEKLSELKRLEDEARSAGRGIWGARAEAPITVSAESAGGHIGERAVVRGRVLRVYRSPNAVFLEFGADKGRGFIAVIFRRYLKGFESVGVDPESFTGKDVGVRGIIKRYGERAEIIVKGPGQIEAAPP